MPKPTYKELWNKAKNLEKENQELKQAVAKLQADQQRKEIQASESSYQELIEGTNAIILKLDVRGNVQFINKFAQQFFRIQLFLALVFFQTRSNLQIT